MRLISPLTQTFFNVSSSHLKKEGKRKVCFQFSLCVCECALKQREHLPLDPGQGYQLEENDIATGRHFSRNTTGFLGRVKESKQLGQGD